ncbi:Uncharacterized protein AF_1420 [Geodia barretti]|uniref:Uncharacterized protein AF_1420 n=1 Tax=Geodia barretti TaxID=519541 RepID=A0AA35S4U8_GEOBA|nr:Uncharacterized protein AF_1420 [Geodia barretti]
MFGLSLGALVAVAFAAIFILNWIKVLNEYERAVVFRFGKLLPATKGPGLVLVFSPIDRMVRVSLRLVAFDVPPQDIITRDNVSVKVNAVLFFRVVDPTRAIIEVQDFLYATSQLAQTTLRSVLGQVELDDLLSQRDQINIRLQGILDKSTDPWGIKVASVEVKHVDLPTDMTRALARQAEAEREKRAKVIHAEGEFQGLGAARQGRRNRGRAPLGRPAPLSPDAYRNCHGEELDDHLSPPARFGETLPRDALE